MQSHCMPSGSSDVDVDADVDAGTCERACRNPGDSPHRAEHGHAEAVATAATGMNWPAHPPPADPQGADAAVAGDVAVAVAVDAAAAAAAGGVVAADDVAAAADDARAVAADDSPRRRIEAMQQLHYG